MQKTLILAGIALLLLGVFWPLLQRLNFGHLPGDIIVKRDSFTIYVPLATSILLSIVLSLLMWFLNK